MFVMCSVNRRYPPRIPPRRRLGRWNNRRVRLTEEEARGRLAGAQVARLATAGADGQPYLVPVTFAVDDDLIYITVDHKPKTTTKLKRLRNIRENPRVALLADHYADDWDAAVVGAGRRLGEHRRRRARGRAPDRRAGRAVPAVPGRSPGRTGDRHPGRQLERLVKHLTGPPAVSPRPASGGTGRSGRCA